MNNVIRFMRVLDFVMVNRAIMGVHKNKIAKNGHDVSPALLCIPNQAKKSLYPSPTD